MTTIQIEKKLNSGSYGNVYKCKDKDNKEYVIKYVKDEKNGIICLMECVIMSSIQYPFLQNAISILPNDDGVYILQECAIKDLELGFKGSEEEKKIALFSIAQAVAVLHQCNIVHGDIKGSNCLMFKDKSVRLTDFSHSFKLFDKKEVIVTSGTITHQAPENVKEKICGKAFDIWALGCTFYEIIYGVQLWPNGCFSSMSQLQENNILDKLISQMVNNDRNKRPNIQEVLSHPYFTGLKNHNRYYIHINKEINKEKINLKGLPKETCNIARKIERCISNPHPTSLKLIAFKLTSFSSIYLGKDKDDIIKEEKRICLALNFRIPIII
jgi:serine/threonine protein kinase